MEPAAVAWQNFFVEFTPWGASTLTPKEIKKCYRRAALKCHPDKGGNPIEFKELSRQFEALQGTNVVSYGLIGKPRDWSDPTDAREREAEENSEDVESEGELSEWSDAEEEEGPMRGETERETKARILKEEEELHCGDKWEYDRFVREVEELARIHRVDKGRPADFFEEVLTRVHKRYEEHAEAVRAEFQKREKKERDRVARLVEKTRRTGDQPSQQMLFHRESDKRKRLFSLDPKARIAAALADMKERRGARRWVAGGRVAGGCVPWCIEWLAVCVSHAPVLCTLDPPPPPVTLRIWHGKRLRAARRKWKKRRRE